VKPMNSSQWVEVVVKPWSNADPELSQGFDTASDAARLESNQAAAVAHKRPHGAYVRSGSIWHQVSGSIPGWRFDFIDQDKIHRCFGRLQVKAPLALNRRVHIGRGILRRQVALG
jgi:hypothetical protein